MKTQIEKVAHLRSALETLFKLCGTKDTYAGNHTSWEYAAELCKCIEMGIITPMLVHGVLLHSYRNNTVSVDVAGFLSVYLQERWHE